jgi:hypothetical protein
MGRVTTATDGRDSSHPEGTREHVRALNPTSLLSARTVHQFGETPPSQNVRSAVWLRGPDVREGFSTQSSLVTVSFATFMDFPPFRELPAKQHVIDP